MKISLKYAFVFSIGILGIMSCKDGDTIIYQEVVSGESEGYSFIIGEGEANERLIIGGTSDIQIKLPEDLKKSDVVAVMAEVKSANGTSLDIQTRGIDNNTCVVKVTMPTFAGEVYNNDAKVHLAPTIYDFGEDALLEVSIVNEKGVKTVSSRPLWFAGTVVENTGGKLADKLGAKASSTELLTVKGTMTEDDFNFIRTSMPVLKGLNLKTTDLTALPKRALAFYGSMGLSDNKVLQKVILPESLREIGMSAFAKCKALSIIKLPESVTTLNDWIFEGAESLRTINIPSGVTTIPQGLFYGALGIETINIPSSVTSIGDVAFAYCSRLKEVILTDNITAIGDDAFNDCDLSSVLIPAKLVTLGNRAFTLNENLTFPNNTVRLPEGFEKIGCSAFNFVNVVIVDLPSTIKEINAVSFMWNKVAQVICRSTIPPTINLYDDSGNEFPPFHGSSKNMLGLRRPAGADYSAWSEYFIDVQTDLPVE